MSVFQLLFRAGCSCVLYPALVLLFLSHVVSCYLLAERVGLVRNTLSTTYSEAEQHMSAQNTATSAHASIGSNIYSHVHDFFRTLLLPLHDILLRSFYLGNHYGLFANMTKTRNEIIIEVSKDKIHWQTVEFLAKPGNIDLPPKSIWFFHMPRLDWVMWFLAFRPGKEELPLWFWELLVSILGGALQLLHPTLNPGTVTERDGKFEFVRVSLVNYQFSGSAIPTNRTETAATTGASSSTETATSATTTAGITPTSTSTMGKYWTTEHLATILPPSTLADLYTLIDTQDPILRQHAAQRRPPSAEDAKEIIMRTLFNKLQSKAKKKEQKQE